MRSAHKSPRYAVGVLLAATAVAASACSSSPSSSSTPATAGTGSTASGGTSSSGTVTNVTLGYVPYSDDASLFYAQSSGIFKKHGLNVTFVAQASPVAVEASMASGTEQFGFITTPVLINLNSKGVNVKCVSSVDGSEPSNPADDSTVLVAAKGSGITSVKDLAGKNVAEVQLTSLNSLAVEILAKRAGISPASIHQIAIPFPQMPAALSQGRVQAAVIVAPFADSATSAGATVLTHPNVDLFPNGTVTCLDAMSSYISANPNVVSEFRAAMNESIAYSQTHEAVVKQTLVKGLSLTPAVAAKQILATNWNSALNTASITMIENYMKQFGVITSEPAAANMVWNP
ncbi:MAG: NitT/TauT family transport system substrate-binding protein [Trebonia sp.]|jgi:NitT/TauT family transport system substrate-binding protein|nr:NitT/TauT family transport system substrate-binding protein [Trebonia sp.]